MINMLQLSFYDYGFTSTESAAGVFKITFGSGHYQLVSRPC